MDDERKAINLINSQPSINFPWRVGRFFVDGGRQITFANDQASFGEDYGTVNELRIAIEWLVIQFGGTVKWKKQK